MTNKKDKEMQQLLRSYIHLLKYDIWYSAKDIAALINQHYSLDEPRNNAIWRWLLSKSFVTIRRRVGSYYG